MKRYVFKKLLISAVFFLTAWIIECITFSLLGFGMMPKYAFLDIALMLFLAGVIFAIPYSTASSVVSVFILALQSLLSYMNITLYRTSGDVFTLDMLAYSGEAAGVLNQGFLDFGILAVFCVIVVVFAAANVFLLIKIKDKFKPMKKTALMLAGVLLFTTLTSGGMFFSQTAAINEEAKYLTNTSEKDNYQNLYFKVNYLYSFGTFSLYLKNIVLNHPVSSILTERNGEELEEYLANAPEQYRSEYFGLDEGNNLVVVMMESLDSIFISEKYTPALYALQNDGINFSRYYAQAKTDYSEASVILGNYPEKQNLVAPWENGGGENRDMSSDEFMGYYPFSLPNILKRNGIEQATYFHSNSDYFYSRKYTHLEYGFDKLFFIDDYPESEKYEDYEMFVNDTAWSMPEKYFVDSALEDMLPTDKSFMSFFTTINAHGSYDESFGQYVERFKEMIDDADFPEISDKPLYKYYKNALSEAMVVNDGIAYLMEQLAERGLADNTTVLFYADHNAYANNLTYDFRGTNITNPNSFTLPAFIYSPNIQNVEIEKFTSTFDIVPTLLDLFGIEYNSRMYLGYNAFSDEESVIISRIGGIFNDKFYSDGIHITYESPDASEEDLQKFRDNYLKVVEKWSFVDKLFFDEYLDSYRGYI